MAFEPPAQEVDPPFTDNALNFPPNLTPNVNDPSGRSTLSRISTESATIPQRPRVELPIPSYDDYEDIKSPIHPTTVGRTHFRSTSLPAGDDENTGSTQQNKRVRGKTHQRSLTELLPFTPYQREDSRSPGSSRATSPSKGRLRELKMPYTGDNKRALLSEGGVKGFSSWVSGAAATITAIGAAKASPPLKDGTSGLNKENTNPYATPVKQATPGTPGTPSTPAITTARTALTSLFGSSSKSVPKLGSPQSDELCLLDLTNALPMPAVTSDASSAKALHNTAMSLLTRYQKSYKERVRQIQELKAEAEAKNEELEGDQVRNRSLKAQLEAMSRTVQKRDDTLQGIMEELMEKNKIIAEMEEQLGRSEEDLEAEDGQRTRDRGSTISALTSTSGSGSEETDAESTYDSVFSQTMSPDSAGLNPPITSSSASVHSTTPRKAPASSRHSLLSESDLDNQPTPVGKNSVYKCENCQGKDASYAWKALSTVRGENMGLKIKCRELEEGIDGVLEGCELGWSTTT